MNTRLDHAGTTAVIGTGTMGRGIARLFLRAGHTVRVHDHVTGLAAAWVESLPDEERLSADGGVRISDAATPADAANGADLIIEAVAEDRAVKAVVLKVLSAHASDDCVIASNTSSFPIDDLAPDCALPERFLGIHFFNPADVIPGVEVIPGRATDPEVVARATAWLTAAGKRPATVRSSPGFIANRLQMALFLECLRCVDEGLVTPEDLDTVVSTTFGFRLSLFGPFAIADMAGLDVYQSIFATLEAGLGEQFTAPESLRSRTARGQFGLKVGQGFKTYDGPQRSELVTARDAKYAKLRDFLEDL
ncbi:3-hydroxyacyl-CoA dehydrogenase family protein [Spirillospora sp. NPDC047279]|uniref:3-hydroxyacyl-CoA dehydrogenase family protein n=1 Tax=Spirillospora sp. NPDC047279 TaxID=3155478 RepID=UPI0033E8B727